MMPSSRMALAALLSALAAAGGCSHDQKAEQTARPVARPAAPPPARRLAVHTPADDRPEAPVAKAPAAVFFDFDSALLKDDARSALQAVADAIRKRSASLEIEGNCDELGTIEYNLALGEERARAAKEYLVHLGVPARQIATVSFGSQRPKYPGHDDDARANNRRDDLVIR